METTSIGLTNKDFAELFRQHSGQLFGLAFAYVRDRDTAYDLVQTTFEKAMLKAHTYSGTGSAKAWLTTILVNSAKNHLRDNKKLVGDDALEHMSESAPTLGETPPSPMAFLTDKEDMARLAAAYNELAPRQREVVRLRIEGGLNYKEIAVALDISSGDARVNYHHAIKRMKAMTATDEPVPATESSS